ncbi:MULTISPECIES: zf-HC2 domain-containing protein [Leucobacter]|uniref:Putative zinc-finger domain-containing protein n=1 Tax=Leucobacter iarius TaxID=333963 RepID=A0ABP4XJT7_9MICO|nr:MULTISPECIES: zf-HC2 domain-containing protein [unclassified Leucobacter]PIJ26480.1 alpha-ketoglutarate decarboxylase [Leucobacter sp. OLES1]KKI20426.1 alpha-ketoglutarate decarboxylase [Leucobacter sp. Ag1]PII83290.1 alpha-ketoglutarate decarboxylase [Leucobacter sp. OLCALW19]PII86841.1 alpha-ketoglutarate decarboxylase [Leucobacter sp. OLTLW20]PII91223.1 alpha-ketoglutarate decarboxylase [Leucobacter sp. OLAS13]
MSGCDCQTARDNLEELLRGELSEGACGPIREHLANCPDCRDEQQVFEHLTIAVKRACEEEAPPSLRDAVLRGLRELDQHA